MAVEWSTIWTAAVPVIMVVLAAIQAVRSFVSKRDFEASNKAIHDRISDHRARTDEDVERRVRQATEVMEVKLDALKDDVAEIKAIIMRHHPPAKGD